MEPGWVVGSCLEGEDGRVHDAGIPGGEVDEEGHPDMLPNVARQVARAHGALHVYPHPTVSVWRLD